jgi:hypothetical protein
VQGLRAEETQNVRAASDMIVQPAYIYTDMCQRPQEESVWGFLSHSFFSLYRHSHTTEPVRNLVGSSNRMFQV